MEGVILSFHAPDVVIHLYRTRRSACLASRFITTPVQGGKTLTAIAYEHPHNHCDCHCGACPGDLA